MSNKNKIAIIFEALGLDKVIASISDFSKKLNNAEKTAKQTVKAAEELDEQTKKLAGDMQKASDDINKTAASSKNLNDANKESKKATEELDNSIKSQTENYKSLSKQLEEQKKARNALADEVLSKESKSTEDLIIINDEYKKTLEDMQKAASANISVSKEDIEIKKKLSKELSNAQKASNELIDSFNKGNASVNSVKRSFEMLGPVMQAVRAGQNKVKAGFEILNQSAAGIMLIAQGVSKLIGMFGGAISKGKEFSEALDAQNKSIQQMSFAISKNSKLTYESNRSLMEFAGQLQAVSVYGDEFTMGLIKTAAQANLNEEEIKREKCISYRFNSAVSKLIIIHNYNILISLFISLRIYFLSALAFWSITFIIFGYKETR